MARVGKSEGAQRRLREKPLALLCRCEQKREEGYRRMPIQILDRKVFYLEALSISRFKTHSSIILREAVQQLLLQLNVVEMILLVFVIHELL